MCISHCQYINHSINSSVNSAKEFTTMPWIQASNRLIRMTELNVSLLAYTNYLHDNKYYYKVDQSYWSRLCLGLPWGHLPWISPSCTFFIALLLLISSNICFQFCCRLLTNSSTPSCLNLSIVFTFLIVSNLSTPYIRLNTLICVACAVLRKIAKQWDSLNILFFLV